MANFRPKRPITSPLLPKGENYEDTFANFLKLASQRAELVGRNEETPKKGDRIEKIILDKAKTI